MKQKGLLALCLVAAMAFFSFAYDGIMVQSRPALAEQEEASIVVPQEPESFKESQGLEYEDHGDGTCSIAGIGACTDSDLVIPRKSPNGSLVKSIDEYAFYKDKQIKSMTIPSGSALVIGNDAFSDCRKLESVTIWNSEVEIGSSAFSNGDGPKSLNIYGGEVEIGEYAFYKCEVTDVTVVGCKLTIDNDAFEYCNNLAHISIDQSTAEIDSSAFANCSDCETVMIHGDEIEIDEYAFYKNELKTVSITADELVIGNDAFEYCDELENLTIAAGTKEIGSSAFANCDSLSEAAIGAGETKIGEYAFYKCESLKKIVIAGESTDPQTKITLDDAAFEYCAALESVIIGHGAIRLKSSVFADCESLTSVVMGSGNLTVGDYAFYHCPDDLVIVSNGGQYTADTIGRRVSYVPSDNILPMVPANTESKDAVIPFWQPAATSAPQPTVTPLASSQDTAATAQYVGTWVIKKIYMDGMESYSLKPKDMGLDGQKIVLLADGSMMLDMYFLALFGQETNMWAITEGCAYINEDTALPINKAGNIIISEDGINFVFEKSAL